MASQLWYKVKVQLTNALKLELIKEIQLNGVHFSLKSYTGFQNQMSAQYEFLFETTSMI